MKSLHLAHASGSETGYGRFGENMARALQKLGVQVDSRPLYEDVAAVHRNAMWLGTPSHVAGWWEGQRPMVFTMWEATKLPTLFRETLHEFEVVCVPSEHNRELFSRHHPDVRVVPLGVDPTIWHPTQRPTRDERSEFVFMTAGQGTRKGVDKVVAAFKSVFGGFTPSHQEPVPRLVIKNRVAQVDVNGDGITQVSGMIPLEDEVALYASANCFVGASRGEGWGLMPFQAIAQGCPTILTDGHGQAEFAHLGIPLPATLVPADYFIYGDAGEWWEADQDELCEAMWDVYVNYDAHLEHAAESAEFVFQHMTWDDAAKTLVTEIGDLLEDPDLTPGGKWYAPVHKLYEVVALRDVWYEVQGEQMFFEKGRLYHESAELKRLMFENGSLDPVCLDDMESGLAPEQVARFGLYRARASICPTCQQRLNTNVIPDEAFLDDGEFAIAAPR